MRLSSPAHSTAQYSAQHIADITTFPRKNLGDKNKHLHLYPGFLSITRVKISWFQVTFNFWMISASFVRCHQAEWGVKTRLLRRGPDRVCHHLAWDGEQRRSRGGAAQTRWQTGKLIWDITSHELLFRAGESGEHCAAHCEGEQHMAGSVCHDAVCHGAGEFYTIDLTILLNNAWK